MIRLQNSLTKQLEPLEIPKNTTIGWYSCGPTVYDSAHLGHARTYLTFDIVRRVLEYYGYTINYVMNITDIDDKIIQRVRERMISGGTDPNQEMNMEMYLDFVRNQEREFWEDMDRLGISRPHVVTHVTDFIDHIIKYIDQIIRNGYAYISNNSVYFDSERFKSAGFNFSPLYEMPSERSDNEFLGEKRSHQDFALWKNAKQGEIMYPSPWGYGRPGWHIECSVMASEILGEEVMIHSGGIDLIFPHHNNEMVQAHAHLDKKDHSWVKMFLHSGHLNIEGLKMAKSLKNFITIKQYLNEVGTAQQLRILFLIHRWHKPLDYSTETIEESKRVEKKFADFLEHVNFLKREGKLFRSTLEQNDEVYSEAIKQIKIGVDEAFRNNVDTQTVIGLLLEGINRTYGYLEGEYNLTLILEFTRFLGRILEVCGLEFTNKSTSDANQWIKLAVDLREDVRDIVKNHKKEIPKPVLGEIFKLLDDFRDVKLQNLGVRLEDRGQSQTTKWVFNS